MQIEIYASRNSHSDKKKASETYFCVKKKVTKNDFAKITKMGKREKIGLKRLNY